MLLFAAVTLAAFFATASAQLYACAPTITYNGTLFRNWRGADMGKWHQCEYSYTNPDGNTGGGSYCFYYTATRGIAHYPDTPIRADSNPSCPTTLPLAGSFLIRSPPVEPSSGNCLTATGTDGAPVVVNSCDGRHNFLAQKWTFDGNTIRQGNLCMDVTNGANADGTGIQTWTCAGNANQKFAHTGGQILSIPEDRISWLTHPDKCLDLTDGDNTAGNQIQIWTCYPNNNNQLWQLEPIT